MKRSTVGIYGPWLARLQPPDGLPELSFRRPRFRSLAAWRRRARRRTLELMAVPDSGPRARPRVVERYEWDGLHVERLQWRLPWGPPVDAIFLKPAGAKGRLPAVLALHCHGGNKALGWRKVARGRETPVAVVREHIGMYYDGRFWANELARRGYAVLAPDNFPFASRRVRPEDTIERVRRKARDAVLSSPARVREYNEWAGGHEHVMAKALFNSGTTWPGVCFAEDRHALDLLAARPDVDPRRLGCGGLSGGGLRTVLLAGLDDRIRAAVCMGFMTTWRDLALQKSWVHAWQSHVPLLPRLLDFPEILGLRAPLPVLVQNCVNDALFSLSEMRRSDRMLAAIYRKARAPGAYRGSFHPGPHKFGIAMQAEAFAWFDRWLGTSRGLRPGG